MTRETKLYYLWLVDFVVDRDLGKNYRDYSDILQILFETDYEWSMEFDENCAVNALDLRAEYGINILEDKNVSILEIMVSLAREMEFQIMSNDRLGDRTSLWFWEMMTSLGISEYKNGTFRASEVAKILDNFVNRRYAKDGKGGLFTVSGCKSEIKNEDLWSQAMKFLSEFAEKNGEIY